MIDTIIRKRSLLVSVLLIFMALGLAACGSDVQDTPEPEEEAIAAEPEATIAEVSQVEEPTDEPAVLPPPQVAVMTNTPVPATETPVPTDTPVPTNTPEPTAVPPTAVPIVPTAVPPTAVPPTEPPPPPPPPPVGANGLIASQFDVESTSAGTNDKVWFKFFVSNSTGSDVSYYSLGVMPKKDGNDRREWYQQSWKGADSVIKASGKEWRDNIKLPEAGDYTLRLVICFDGYEICTTGGGTFHSLSPEVPVKIN